MYPRFAESRLEEALEDSPVVLLHGPRQSGKTTLARSVGDRRDYAYLSFDDPAILSAATSDPVGFLGDLPDRVILDEVQRVPNLFTPIKMTVDRDRRPGRFLLTGSANVLLVPTLADSLAGRMDILRLHPLAQSEIHGQDNRFLDRLFQADFHVRTLPRLGPALADILCAGGYPSALTRTTPRRRAAWYRDFLETIVQRDVRDLSRIGSLEMLPRLLEVAAGQSARLMNLSDLASPFQKARATIRAYITLLERVFLLEELPPWHSNRLSRLVKTPKVHLCDSGLACALLDVDGVSLWKDKPLLGQVLETFVFQELRRQGDWNERPPRLFHFRDRDNYEVDMVVERGTQELAGVEVKASATVTAADFRGLRKLRDAAGDRFRCGVVLYDGEACVGFGDGLFAVPIRMLWEA
ncbi:hypothetical protein METESE_09530 [Mesoterricola sediminis]|uniref:ATP-binding protein n=1 Tax=Mesoterricola sediminis TaxID=2927980 RepID=A0AA48KCF2_9BACT|nr:ATP-binding protein [Mesoterricola sediminis]BDU75995.1 hypothetical protein METESE_09530 [Mesoterricola sediminis]